VKRTNTFAALFCVLLALSLASCGGSNNLQSITLSAKYVNGVPPTGQSGFVTLEGNGGTIQLQAMGEYSSTKTKDLSNEVTYTAVVDPQNNVDAFGNILLPPCKVGTCPNPGQAPPYTTGTLQYSPTGLVTAVEPATCTWVDIAPLGANGTVPTPAWFYSGDYVVTATFGGISSQPVFIPVASSAGSQFYNGQENNPSGACGPTPTGG
jgi:hypothetical protein